MARALSTTSLEVGTLSIPVSIAAAVDAQKDPSFDRRSPEGNALNRIEVDSETREEVAAEDVLYGVDTVDGFQEISKETLEAYKDQTKIDHMTIEEFVPIAKAQEYLIRAQGAYYLQPVAKFGSARPMKLLYEAMKKRKVVAVTKVVLRSRQSLAIIQASPSGAFVMNTIAFDGAWRQPDEEALAPQSAEVQRKMVERATELVEALTTDGEFLRAAEDDLIPLKHALFEEAIEGKLKSKPKAKPKSPDKMVERLEAELEASIADIEKKKAKAA